MEKKFYGMKNDYMFKAVLQECEEVLKNLVAALMGMDESDIESCTIQNPIELGASLDAKDCILDIKLILNNEQIMNIELQMQNEGNWPERSLLYWSRAYDQIRVGEDYDMLRRTYHIGILGFSLFPDTPQLYSEYLLINPRTQQIYTDKLSIRVLDITQAENDTDADPRIVKWAKIFKAKTMDELDRTIGTEEVFTRMKSKIVELSEEERVRLQLQARADYESRLTSQYNAGVRAGVEQGIEQGIEQTCLKMLGEGIDIEVIARCTGLSAEKIAEYKNSLKQ